MNRKLCANLTIASLVLILSASPVTVPAQTLEYEIEELQPKESYEIVLNKKMDQEVMSLQKSLDKINVTEQVSDFPEKRLYDLTDYDCSILSRIVEAEATDKDLKSKILVANVVLNRLKSSEFPNTIEGVVFQRENGAVQFSPTADGRYYSVNVTDSSRESVDRALKGEDYSQGALYFVERSIADPDNVNWFDRALTRLFEYQGHAFYK